jgi:REP element-mobilizing transposase RayT
MRPRRIRQPARCTYLGPRIYFVTILTKARRRVFEDERCAAVCIAQFLRAAGTTLFRVRAYSVLPDHAHLVVEGLDGRADFRRFMKRAKQLSGYHVKQLTGQAVWSDGYYDRVIRHDEDISHYLRYVLLNPVKARLADAPGVHPYTWVQTFEVRDHATSKPDLQVGRATTSKGVTGENGLLSPGKSSPD